MQERGDSATASQAILERELALFDGWLQNRTGPLGRAFKAALAKTGAPETVSEEPAKENTSALFIMSFNQASGFQQAIHYAEESLRGDREEFFNTRIHEGTHAIQASKAACLHAGPGSEIKIYLRPRDRVWVRELMEKDAYAKAMLLSAQLFVRQNDTEEAGWTKCDTMEFARNVISVVDAMLRMAPQDADGEPVSAKEQYNRTALSEYDSYAAMIDEIKKKTGAPSATQVMKKHGFPVPVYVRLEPQDIVDIGNSFGINLFADEQLKDAGFSSLQLSPFMEDAVRRMNKALEIENEENLPVFGEALAAQGLDREKFLAVSRRPASP